MVPAWREGRARRNAVYVVVERAARGGEYALLVAGADPAEVRLGDTENLGKAYAAALPSGSDSLLVSLDSPLYVESVTGIKGGPMAMRPRSHRPRDIRRILRLTIDAGKGFGGAKVEGRLDGIASSVRLSDRIATGVGVLDLDFRASAAGVAGVYQNRGGYLGYGDAGRLGPEQRLHALVRDRRRRAFQLQGEPDREPA